MTTVRLSALMVLMVASSMSRAEIVAPDGAIRIDSMVAEVGRHEQSARIAVSVDTKRLLQAADLVLPGRDGESVLAKNGKVTRHLLAATTWSGTVDTMIGPQTATITVSGDQIFGRIPQRQGPPLLLEPRAGGAWLVQGDDALGEPHGPDVLLPPTATAAGRAKRARQDDMPAAVTPVVDVAVMYNGELVDVWGGNAAVLARIAFLEALTNQAYLDTGMDMQVRVVAAQLVEYSLRNDNSDALRELSGPASLPIHLEAKRLREQYGADLVKLMRNFDRSTQNSCGVGWLGGYHGSPFEVNDGYTVTSDHGYRGDNCGEYTFSHELGHNLGAHHDIETTSGDHGAYAYSRGHRRTIDASLGFATVMAYATGPQNRIGRFSNPLQSDCQSFPCGVMDESDNARGLVQASPAVAAYAPTKVPGAGPSVSVSDVSVVEGNSGQVVARFTFTLSAPSANGVSLELATAHGSATGADYIGSTASFLIPAGQVAATFDVRVRGDTLAERDEVFALNILSASGAWVADGQGVATILNDDPLPTLDVADVHVSEGDAGVTQATFTATLSQAATTAVTFDVKTDEYAPGPTSATSGADFEDTRLTGVRIEPGQSSVQFTIPIFGDELQEQDERVLVMISNVTAAAIGDIFARAIIVDDDGASPAPQLFLDDASLPEGNTGQASMAFEARLSAPAPQDVTFSVASTDITATADQDYVAPPSATLRIAAGQTRLSVPVVVIGDVLDEADEVFALQVINAVGAEVADGFAYGRILDDDGAAATPPFVARDDRFVVLEQGGAVRLAVIANDAVEATRLSGGSLSLLTAPTGGGASVDNGGTPATAVDDAIVYLPRSGETGPDRLRYRLCEGAGRCSQATVWIERRPQADVNVEADGDGGYLDLPMDGLPAIPDMSVRTVSPDLVRAQSFALAVDPTPETPWDLELAGTALLAFSAAPLTDFDVGFGIRIDTRYRLLADGWSHTGGDIDLYVGVDDNGDGRPDPREVRCVAAMTTGIERCESSFTTPAAGTTPLWVMLHSRTGQAQTAGLEVSLFQFEQSTRPALIRATGPGIAPAGQAFPIRVSWWSESMDPGERRTDLVAIGGEPGAAMPRVFPTTLVRTNASPAGAIPLWGGETWVWLAPGGATRRHFVDVPAGVGTLTAVVEAEATIDLQLHRIEPAAGPVITPAPAAGAAVVEASGLTGYRELAVPAAQVAPGRWHLAATSRSGQGQWVRLALQAGGIPVLPDRGSYYNPERGGHGLFVYPAGNQWAGLWYTYFQDGSPTWYYLQAPAPNAAGGRWVSPIYRSAWNGSRNLSTPVGTASLAALGNGQVVFTYELDGQVGSERLDAFGAGCPTSSGLPVDASAHWFDPARAGTGYSVQLFPDYEFHAAFLYDALGVPRFLTAESPRFAGDDAVLALEQLSGFCPLCERVSAPARSAIGTLRRRFSGGTLVLMEVDAVYAGGVPGVWSAADQVQLLGGPGSTQGCPPP